MLAPGRRTVRSALHITGRAAASNFTCYHQVLNRVRWSSLAVAGRLPVLIIDRLVRDPNGARPIQAFSSTDTDLSPEDILAFFVRRWPIEVTFAEVRAHLGVETQRPWSDLAILRTTPALLGFYSLITLWTAEPLNKGGTPYAPAWYAKIRFTFSDAIAAVRLKIWIRDMSSRSTDPPDQQKIPPDRLIRIAHAICHAA